MATQQATSNPQAFGGHSVRNISADYTISEVDNDAILVMKGNVTLSLGDVVTCAGTKLQIIQGKTNTQFTLNTITGTESNVVQFDANGGPAFMIINNTQAFDFPFVHLLLFCNGKHWFLNGYVSDAATP
jgi:hypothetical protein